MSTKVDWEEREKENAALRERVSYDRSVHQSVETARIGKTPFSLFSHVLPDICHISYSLFMLPLFQMLTLPTSSSNPSALNEGGKEKAS